MPFSKGRALDIANQAIKRGQYGKAIGEYQRIVKQDPTDIRSKLKLGDLYIRTGELSAAVQVLREVAELYSRQGFTLKSVAVYSQILKIDPNLADVSTALADHYRQIRRLNEAIRHYKHAARLYAKQGKPIERLETIRKMVELDPENVPDRVRLAEGFSAAGRYSDAVALFRQACLILERHERPQLYCAVAERLLHHQPDDFAVNRQLAATYLKDRDAQRALPKLRTCYRQKPRDLAVLDMLQETFDLLGQPHKAISVLREMARLYAENGLLAERDATYERMLRIDGTDSEARRALQVVSAVGEKEQQVVLEHDDEAAQPPAEAFDEEEAFEEVDLDDGDLVEVTSPGEERTVADTEPEIPVLDGEAERPLDDIFEGIDDEIDIQEDAEDTVVMGEIETEEFDEFDLDDGLSAKPGRRRAEVGEPEWTALFDDAAAAEGGDDDLARVMREAEQAVSQRGNGGGPKGAPARTQPADHELQESLEEVDFYISNELLDDARELLDELRTTYPDHPEILGRMKRLETA